MQRSSTPRMDDLFRSASPNTATTPTNERSLLGWMKTALTVGRASSSSPSLEKNNHGHSSTPTPTTADRRGSSPDPFHQLPHPPPVLVSSSASSPAPEPAPLPTRNLEAEFADRTDRDSTSGSPASSAGRASMDDSSIVDSDDEDDELYEPYQPAQDPLQQPQASAQQQQSNNYAEPANAQNALGNPLPGLIKPTARRSVSMQPGDQDDIADKISRMKLRLDQRASVDAPLLSAASIDSARTSNIHSPPSLILTPPDASYGSAIVSPIVEGWAGPSSPPQGYHNMTEAEKLAAAFAAREARNEQAASPTSPASPRTPTNEEAPHERPPNIELQNASWLHNASTGEEWDEARAKTPKVLADIARSTSGPAVYRRSPGAKTPPNELDSLSSAAPTPRPDQGRGFVHDEAPPSPKATNVPVRRLFFGSRFRSDSGGEGHSGSSQDGGHHRASSPSQPRQPKQRNPSNSSFWRLGRKTSQLHNSEQAEVASTRVDSPAKRSLMPKSTSQASSLSVDSASTRESAYSRPASRPVSMISTTGSFGANGWGKASKAKGKTDIGLNGDAAPRKMKTRAKNKSAADCSFSKLYLAQELSLGGPTYDPSSRASTSSFPSFDSNGSRGGNTSVPRTDRSGSDADIKKRPALTQTQSQASISTMDSRNFAADSAMSHGTVASSNEGSKRRATWAMTFSRDGRYLAVAGQDTVIRVFEVLDTPEKREAEVNAMLNEAEIKRATSHMFRRNSRVSQDSARSGGYNADSYKSHRRTKSKDNKDGPVLKPIPVFSSRPIREFRGHTSDVLSLDWSKGNFLLSSSMDKTVRVWHLSRADGSLITFGHGDFVTSAVFHPKDDRFFLIGSLDGKLRLWNITSRRVQASALVPGLITSVAFSASGTSVIAGTFSGALLFYETDNLAYQSSVAVRSSSTRNSRSGRKITGIEAIQDVSPDLSFSGRSGSKDVRPMKVEESILITSNDSRVRVLSLADKRLTAKYRGSNYLNRTSQIRASHTGGPGEGESDAFVIAGSESGEVYVWSAVRNRDFAPSSVMSGINASSNSASSSFSSSSNLSLSSSSAGAGKPHTSATSTTSESYEAWTASDHGRPVTVAVMAPLKTQSCLLSSADQVEASLGRGSGAAGGLLQGWDPGCNRIVLTVDESMVVRVFRAVGGRGRGADLNEAQVIGYS